MLGLITNFCVVSGQTLSTDKSIAFNSAGVEECIKKNIEDITGIKFTTNLGKYLSIPLFNERVNKKTFEFVVEKLHKRLMCWKAKNLSLAGRCTLVEGFDLRPPFLEGFDLCPPFVEEFQQSLAA